MPKRSRSTSKSKSRSRSRRSRSKSRSRTKSRSRSTRSRAKSPKVKAKRTKLNLKDTFKKFMLSKDANLPASSLPKLCAEKSLPITASGDSVNDIVYTKSPELVILRVHHISDKWVLLERMNGVKKSYGAGIKIFTVGEGTGKFVKIPNKSDTKNFRISIKKYTLTRLDSDGNIYYV